MNTEHLRLAFLERVLAGLDQLGAYCRRPAQAAHLLAGMAGEDAAFFWLRRKGYTVVARRWSAGKMAGDVDLIAWDGPMLCFVEVKTRTARDMTPAEAAVDRHKRHMVRRLAHAYLRQLPQAEAPPVRFDVLSVYLLPGHKPDVEHFRSAFGWSEERYED